MNGFEMKEGIAPLYATLSIPPGRYIPLIYTFNAEIGPHAGETASFQVNGDGSLYVENWRLLEWFRSQEVIHNQQFGILTLLFAARGHIREVSKDEANRIAEDTAKKAYPNG